MQFPTEYQQILQRLKNINASTYAQTRNFIDGAVTYLSPYISRGVISLPQVKAHILQNYKPYQVEKLLQELAWREYWQRVWQAKGDAIFTDLKQPQPDAKHHRMPTAVENATTGINAIDGSIETLYSTGYMHNHFRMYLASVCCNIGRAHWLQPSAWMYYHLLDGDLASNSLSWQWICASFSSKKYYCNQENINRYTKSFQQNTFLDTSYESLVTIPIPQSLAATNNFSLKTDLPQTPFPTLKDNEPVIIYNSDNLDPLWHAGENANRILLLEPSHFKNHPISAFVLQFVINLSKNIAGIQIFVGEFYELKHAAEDRLIIFKSHPAFLYYTGKSETYDYLFPEVSGYFPSFSAYWKKCERYSLKQ